MGLFDSVMVPCPRCGKEVEFQSKADDDPYMRVYRLPDVPAHIQFDVMNEPHYCQACGSWFALIDPDHPPGPRRPPKLRAVSVHPPENPVTHHQGFRWWPDDKPFTYADLTEPLPSR